MVLLLAGCAERQRSGKTEGVVTLSPALTEVVFAVGRGDRLVGITTACDYPPEVERIPRVTDYRLNVEAVVAAGPSLVLADMTVNNPDEVSRLESLGVRVERFTPTSVAATAEMIRTVGRLLGASEKGAEVARELESAGQRLASPPKVVFTLGKDGLYVAGSDSLTADCVRRAGGEVTADHQAKFYPASRESVLFSDPDVIFTTGDPKEFLEDPLWQSCKAVANRSVYHVDASLATRPGPRLAEAIRVMSEVLSKLASR
jgi:iron complex transport system substrate-binding protein